MNYEAGVLKIHFCVFIQIWTESLRNHLFTFADRRMLMVERKREGKLRRQRQQKTMREKTTILVFSNMCSPYSLTLHVASYSIIFQEVFGNTLGTYSLY